jgi:heterodisulfide reductase subunit B
VYFTQLMGLAFGFSERELGLQRGFIPMKPLPAQAQPQAVAA